MNRKTLVALSAVSLVLLSTNLVRADEMDDLKKAFATRDPAIRALKDQHTIGETSKGYLDAPKATTPENQKLLDQENADRKRLYALIAVKDGATSEVVADRAARRNFTLAKSGDLLKYPDGVWRSKK